MRRIGAFVALTVLLAARPAFADEAWRFDGGGWGHGVGLSQYGAHGMALEGRTYQEILTHYYVSTEVLALGDVVGGDSWILADSDPLWIALATKSTKASLQAIGGPVEVCQNLDGSECVIARTIPAGAKWNVLFENGGCRLDDPETPDTDEAVGDCWMDLTWTDDGGTTRVGYGTRSFAHGRLHVRPASTNGFHLVLELPIREYLWGLGEMPSSWPMEALKAQVVAARTYAASNALARGPESGFSASVKSSCWCHLGSSSASQVYVGWSKESEGTNGQWGARWKSAVDATSSQVIAYQGKLIGAFYSSSTGGATENNEDIWGGEAIPYLRSVPDPWSVDPAVGNPYASWTVFVDGRDLAAALGLESVHSARIVKGPPGALIEFRGIANGAEVTVTKTGWQVRSILGTYGWRSDGKTVATSPYISGVTSPWWFEDIADSKHRGDILELARLGVTRGCNPPDNTLFCPNGTVTRGQMAAFLTRALSLPAATKDWFTDDDGTTFENDINRLAEAGITKGCATGRFCADQPVTREQMAAFLVRAFHLPAGTKNRFTDDDGSIFEGDIDRLASAGITKGCNPPTNDRFCPKDPVTRAQMASFLVRALKSQG
jgi:hypothetical protein